MLKTLKIRLRIISGLLTGIIAAGTTLSGAVAQMVSEGKTNFSDISDLVWLLCLISMILGTAKDINSYLKNLEIQQD